MDAVIAIEADLNAIVKEVGREMHRWLHNS